MIHGKTPTLLLLVTLLLIAFGLTMVYSASANKASGMRLRALQRVAPEELERNQTFHDAYYLKRQAVHAAIGLCLLLIFTRFDYDRLRRFSPLFIAVGIGLLCLVWVPGIGVKANGAYRWIVLGPLRLQPSEGAKIALVIYTAAMLADHQNVLHSLWRCLFFVIAPALLVCGLIAVEPNYSTAVLLFGVVSLLWFIGGMPIRGLAAMASLALPAAAVGLIMKPYRLERLKTWLSLVVNGIQDREQASQSLIAIGTGGPLGVGLGNSMMKYDFLPEAHTDFIFAVIGEELGFVGAVCLIVLFGALILLGWTTATRAADPFGRNLAAGLTLTLAVSVVINLLVAVGYLPTTGQPLPFISYGGSSMLMSCVAIGILINIAKFAEPRAAPARSTRRRSSKRSR